MSRRPRSLPVAVAAVALAACGPTALPNFGGLEPDARTLKVKNDVRLLELTNGMQVALVPDDRTNLVSVDVRYRVGSNQDPAGRAGLAHLAEHLLFQTAGDSQGTPLYDKFAALALTFNAFTGHDVTHYTSTALANRVDALLELEARRLETPCASVPEPAFVRERDVVLEEDAQRDSSWSRVLSEVERAVWGTSHPYGHPVGTREVAKATKAEVCALVDRYYTPKRAILVVSGNINPDALQPRIGRRFGPIARTSDVPKILDPIEPARLVGTRSAHTGDVDHPTAVIVLPAPPWGSPDEVVHDATLAAVSAELYALDARTDWILDVGMGYGGDSYQRTTMIVVEVTDAARLDAAVAAVLKAGQGVLADDDHDGNADDDDDPDDRTIAHYLASLRGRLQTRTITANDRFWGKGEAIADYLTYTDHYDFAFARMRATDALTGNQIVAYAHQLFDPARLHVARVTPTGAAGSAPARSARSRRRPTSTTCRRGGPRSTRRPRRAPRRCRRRRRRWPSRTSAWSTACGCCCTPSRAAPRSRPGWCCRAAPSTSPSISAAWPRWPPRCSTTTSTACTRRGPATRSTGRCGSAPSSPPTPTRRPPSSAAAAWRCSPTGTCGGWPG